MIANFPARRNETATLQAHKPRQDDSDSDCGYGDNTIIHPADPKDTVKNKQITATLQSKRETFQEIKSDELGFTAFWWVDNMEESLGNAFKDAGVSATFYKFTINRLDCMAWPVRQSDEKFTGLKTPIYFLGSFVSLKNDLTNTDMLTLASL